MFVNEKNYDLEKIQQLQTKIDDHGVDYGDV